MADFLATSIAPRLDLTLLRRDHFDGFSLLLQDADGLPFDLAQVQVCAAVWKEDAISNYSIVTSFNVEKEEPLNQGRIRLWLSSAQTNSIWEAYEELKPKGVFFPSAYTQEQRSRIYWDVRIDQEEEMADLIAVSGGTFVTQVNHSLGSTERVVFRGTNQSSINYDNTTARVYSNLTSISYSPPYAFTVPALSGITDAAIGGNVGRLKQDTVAAGTVNVGTTLANCFP